MWVTRADPDERGHNKVCTANSFGPTPPESEQCLYDHFDCLQRTGDWCDGDFKSGPVPVSAAALSILTEGNMTGEI